MRKFFSDGNVKSLVIIIGAIIISVLLYTFKVSSSTSSFFYGLAVSVMCALVGKISSDFLIKIKKVAVRDFSKPLWRGVLNIEVAIILIFFIVGFSVKIGIHIQGSLGYIIAYIAVALGLESVYFLILDIVRSVSKEYNIRLAPSAPM